MRGVAMALAGTKKPLERKRIGACGYERYD